MDNSAQEKLFKVGTELFARKGLAGVSIREIAKAAEVNSSLISYHFEGKEGLYKLILEEQFRPIEQLAQNMSNLQMCSQKQRLKFYAESVAHIHRQRPFLLRFLTSELVNPTSYFESVVEKHITSIFRFINNALAEGIKNGEFSKSLNIEHATISLAGIMNFYFIVKPLASRFITITAESDFKYIQDALDIYLKGITRRDDK